MRVLLSLLLLALLPACSHTIDLRTSPFMSPLTENEPLKGRFSVTIHNPARITLIESTSATPPTEGNIKIDEDVAVEDVFFGNVANSVGLDGALGIWQGLSAYKSGINWGLKYQFINHGSQTDVWVAAAQVSLYGGQDKEETTELNSDTIKTKSEVTNQQYGLSIGYKFPVWTPYFSAVVDEFKSKVSITNNQTAYSPYEDTGRHTNYSLGIASTQQGIDYGLEYTYSDIKWDRGGNGFHKTLAGRLGFSW